MAEKGGRGAVGKVKSFGDTPPTLPSLAAMSASLLDYITATLPPLTETTLDTIRGTQTTLPSDMLGWAVQQTVLANAEPSMALDADVVHTLRVLASSVNGDELFYSCVDLLRSRIGLDELPRATLEGIVRTNVVSVACCDGFAMLVREVCGPLPAPSFGHIARVAVLPDAELLESLQ